jgi:hypothetical protein
MSVSEKCVGHVLASDLATMSSSRLLQLAIPLVKTHGFTRKTLSLSALSLPTPHTEPLSDTAISSLWGQGDDARRTLITAWLDDARQQMKNVQSPTIREVLRARLQCNEPVLSYLPEVRLSRKHSAMRVSHNTAPQAFALLASPTSGLPPLDIRPGLRHAATIADDACWITKDAATGVRQTPSTYHFFNMSDTSSLDILVHSTRIISYYLCGSRCAVPPIFQFQISITLCFTRTTSIYFSKNRVSLLRLTP